MAEIKKDSVDLNELVPVKLFRDDDRYSEPLYVGLNGKNWRIERGVEVMVPRYVKIRIDEIEEAEAKAAIGRAKLSRQFEQDSKRF